MTVIGFIGFGEAAFHIASGLKEEGAERIFAFDVMYDHPEVGPRIKERLEKTSVQPSASLAGLIQASDVILCATSAKYAVSIAKQAAETLTSGKMYADLNSASPDVKREAAQAVEASGALFIDAAVMEAVPPHRHKVPIFASGSGAKKFQEVVAPFGMNITFVNGQAGSSSAMKMVRSSFMKGFTSLLLETLHAAYKCGIESEIIESIQKSIAQKPIAELANLLVNRSAIHAERRVTEMSEVMLTLGELGVDSTMSEAAKQKLQLLVDKNLKEKFGGEPPDHFIEVLRALDE